MSKLYHLESMSVDDLEREFDRLDQERRLRAVAERQARRLAGTAGELGQADLDPDHCDLWSPRRATR
jgi:hypothetical protein